MDSRPHPPPPPPPHMQPYSAPQDRPPLTHASQQQPPPSTASPFYRPPTSSSQSVQIPFADPFRSRPADPFLPNPHHQRRGSYGLPSGRESTQYAPHGSRESNVSAWPGSSGPPSNNISQSHHESPTRLSIPPNIPPPGSSSFAYASARRNSLGSGKSPPSYYAQSPQDHIPPPGFGPRPMLPPSPSQQSSTISNYASQRSTPLPPPPFSSRELPSISSSSRQGSGMSISALLGDGPPSGPPPPRSQQSSVPPSLSSTMRPPSPRSNQSNGHRDRPHWGRPETPERTTGSAPPMRLPESGPYPPNASPRYYNPPPRDSPELNRNPPPSYHNQPTPPRAHMYQASSREPHDPRHLDDRPPRPSSQPVQYGLPPRNDYPDSRGPPPPQPPPYNGNSMHRVPSQEAHPAQPPQYYDRPNMTMHHDRPVSSQPSALPAYQNPNRSHDDHNLLRRNLLGQEPPREEPRRDYGSPKRDEYTTSGPGPQRTGYRGQYYSQPPTSMPPLEAPRSHPHAYEPARRHQDQYPPDHMQGFPRPSYEHDRRGDSVPLRPDSRTGYDPQPRRSGGEEMQPSRSFLGISSDPNKRGRASPLPQAVKGAQAQMTGPGSDPSIKSEFGRIFQGLGSGLGGPGTLTPSRQSPVPQRIRDDIPTGDGDGNGIRMSRVGSRGGKVRRGRDDDVENGRQTPIGSGSRGGRKSKQLLQHNQPVRQIDDDSPTAIRAFNSFPASHQQDSLVIQQMPPPKPIAKPTIKISSESVLKSVADLPRHHLGSALYDVAFIKPPHASTLSNDKWGYCMQYKPSRRFSSEDYNCTFTLRVSRDYLTEEMREKLCTDRYLYGTDIYTEDSDPLLAAIHSGWIRGAWSPEIDTSLMDLPPVPAANIDASQDLVEPPAFGPVLPPPNMDCHIELLILPALTSYTSGLLYGVKSRPWDHHDGLSFRIIGLKWRDEGSLRNVERTGKGRRAKLASQAHSDGTEPVGRKKRKLNGTNDTDLLDSTALSDSKVVSAAA